jgi:CO/xanthine dehydrogenase Mo-binding subunit
LVGRDKITYGAKDAGEIACVSPMAAITNAIYNATGVRVSKLPLSPENVLRGLKEAGKGVTQTRTKICRIVVGAG